MARRLASDATRKPSARIPGALGTAALLTAEGQAALAAVRRICDRLSVAVESCLKRGQRRRHG
jgi:hypothetical protein